MFVCFLIIILGFNRPVITSFPPTPMSISVPNHIYSTPPSDCDVQRWNNEHRVTWGRVKKLFPYRWATKEKSHNVTVVQKIY